MVYVRERAYAHYTRAAMYDAIGESAKATAHLRKGMMYGGTARARSDFGAYTEATKRRAFGLFLLGNGEAGINAGFSR